jgi:hypothetical protein
MRRRGSRGGTTTFPCSFYRSLPLLLLPAAGGSPTTPTPSASSLFLFPLLRLLSSSRAGQSHGLNTNKSAPTHTATGHRHRHRHRQCKAAAQQAAFVCLCVVPVCTHAELQAQQPLGVTARPVALFPGSPFTHERKWGKQMECTVPPSHRNLGVPLPPWTDHGHGWLVSFDFHWWRIGKCGRPGWCRVQCSEGAERAVHASAASQC